MFKSFLITSFLVFAFCFSNYFNERAKPIISSQRTSSIIMLYFYVTFSVDVWRKYVNECKIFNGDTVLWHINILDKDSCICTKCDC